MAETGVLRSSQFCSICRKNTRLLAHPLPPDEGLLAPAVCVHIGLSYVLPLQEHEHEAQGLSLSPEGSETVSVLGHGQLRQVEPRGATSQQLRSAPWAVVNVEFQGNERHLEDFSGSWFKQRVTPRAAFI